MEFTGERVIPGRTDPDLLNEHVARYRFAEALVGGRTVLDAGCGVGYGSAELARRAEKVYALDNAHDAVVDGLGRYGSGRVRFVQGSCAALPFPDRSLDVVVAFEVIEHLENWKGLLTEARRVLRPDGQLLVSTPNRPYYEETRSEPNPYHVHEFDYAEFRDALLEVFPHTAIFLENHTQAITFTPEAVQGLRTSIGGAPPKPEESHFFLAVCSESPQYGSPAFVFVPESGNVLREREKHIDLLEGELAKKTAWLEETTREHEKLTRVHRKDQEAAQEAIEKLEAEIEDKNEWGEKLNAEIAELRAELDDRTHWAQQLEHDYREVVANYERVSAEADEFKAKVQGILDDVNRDLVEKAEWAQRLDREVGRLRAELQAVYASKGYKLAKALGLSPKPGS